MDRTPSVDMDLARVAPALTHWAEMDELREAHRFFWSERGQHWVLTRSEDIKEAGHDAVTFSNHSIVPSEPNPDYRFLPSHLDPPDHLKYRQIMNAWFAPPNVAKLAPGVREIAGQIADELAPSGSCDFIADFGNRYPVRVLLFALGLPLDDGPMLVERVRRRARLRAQGDIEGSMVAWNEMETYWKALIADRRAAPRDPSKDFITHLLNAKIDGGPVPEADIVDILVTLTVGGIDTTRAQLGWCIYHFATHPEDLQRVKDDPSLMPTAIEEFMRAYSIIGMGRKVTQDVDFHGCPMKKDDMVLLWYPSACRDPRLFPDAATVHIDREDNRHVNFGNSLHRCLGSHLGRAEMTIGVEEFLRAVPNFRLATEEQPMAMGGQISLLSLPLVWDV